MGDAENRSSMDRSNSNSSSSDEPAAAEKKMRVEVPSADTELPMDSPDSKNSSPLTENKDSNGSFMTTTTGTAPLLCPTLVAEATQEPLAEVTSTSLSNVPETSVAQGVPVAVEDEGELVELKVVYNKLPLQIKMSLKKTVGDLKVLIEKETKVAPALQKVLIKGISKDHSTLESLGVTKLTKILVIGTSLSDVMEVTKPPDKESMVAEDLSTSKDLTNWCTLPQHKKVIDKGIPDDAMPGILNESEPLPEIPLFGMLSAKGAKVRLTFKLELDELWIGTKERTDKVPIGSIRNVENQPIPGYEHYHIVAIQLGPTEASRFFVYWVPSQYVEAIKDALAN